jgi:hypothetical protein
MAETTFSCLSVRFFLDGALILHVLARKKILASLLGWRIQGQISERDSEQRAMEDWLAVMQRLTVVCVSSSGSTGRSSSGTRITEEAEQVWPAEGAGKTAVGWNWVLASTLA